MVHKDELTWKPSRNTIFLFLVLCAAGLFFAGLTNLFAGRVSSSRLFFFGLAFLGSLGLLVFGWKIRHIKVFPAWVQNFTGQKAQILTIAVTALALMAGWYLVWTPPDQFGKLFYYAQASYPFAIWLTCTSAGALFLLLAARFGINLRHWQENFLRNKYFYLFSGSTLAIFGLLALAAAFRVVGVQQNVENFWYGAGVPVLAFQVFTALLLGIGSAFLIKIMPGRLVLKAGLLNVLLFLAIWGVSAWLWANEPVKPDFLINQPVAPNYEMYPDYDARMYDMMSQFALIGQGINNHSFFDRVLYPALLVYIHNFAGQDYTQVMAVQAGLFAIIPALIFLIGNSLYNRVAGLSLAILTALRGVNSINVGNIIDTSHQKQMLTEFPTFLLLVLATWLIIKWMQNPSKNWTLAGLAGAVIGLSTLVRPHTLMIIPIFLILAFFIYRSQTRIFLGVGALFFTAALFSILPWVQFGGQNVNLISLYSTRIEDVIRSRYPRLLPRATPSSMNEPLNAPQPAVYKFSTFKDKTILAFTIDNLLNNMVTTIQSLPTTPFNLDAHTVVKKTENFWQAYWDGSLSFWAVICTAINLVLVALGLGTAWKKARWVGLVPFILMLGYYFANSLGRTSGGRYIVPADWVILIYYVFGLLAVFEIVSGIFQIPLRTSELERQTAYGVNPWWLGALLVLAGSFAMGALIPLSQTLHPLMYPKTNPQQLADTFISLAGNELNLTKAELNQFLTTSNAVIITGRSLYPRQFAKDEGLQISVYNFYHPLPYPRTLFTVIGSTGAQVIQLARMDAAKIPNVTDVMAVGCQSDGYILAWAVIRLDDHSIYKRTPGGAPLACPLPTPVCDNNKSCH